MKCYVYKSDIKQDHYLYLGKEFESDNPPAEVPESLLRMMGELQLVVDFTLTPTRKLPNADAEKIINDISDKGFYLQLPSDDMYAEEARIFN